MSKDTTQVTMKKGEMLSKAILIATQAHYGQFDRGGNPYISHTLTVLHKVGKTSEEVQCIAVMHDVIEDCTGKQIYMDGTLVTVSFSMLAEMGMSERVIAGIRALTKMPGQTYDEYRACVMSNEDAMLVKLEDLRHNSDIRRLKGVYDKDIARMVKYQKFYLEIQNTLETIKASKSSQ